MRLVCPNCAAQYDVDDRVIPPGGRDVQCSNCGHSWFQAPAGAAEPAVTAAEPAAPAVPPEAAAEAATPAPAETGAPEAEAAAEIPPETGAAETGAAPETEPGTAPPEADDDHAAGNGRRMPQPEVDTAWEEDEPVDHLPGADTEAAEPADRAEAGPDQSRRGMDEAVFAILREEAEREARARKADTASGMEEQGDLGLPAPAPVPRRPEPPEEPAEPAAPPPEPAGEPPLPDTGEITATLDAPDIAETGPEPEPPPAAPGRSGFRTGFTLMLALGLLALAAYVLAPALSALIPGLADPLAGYVAAVDELRIRLDGTLRGLVAGDGGGA